MGGFIGGAIGGGIEGGWKGAGFGALQGAGIGASIGAGVGAGIEMGAAASLPTAAEATALEAVAAGLSAVAPSTTAMAIGGIAGGALMTGSNIYNAAMKDQMVSAAFSAAAKALNGLPEHDHFREHVFLRVLTQVVDDPNVTNGTCQWLAPFPVTGDPDDTDGDGNTTEQISCFQYWWTARVNQLKEEIPGLRAIADSFIHGPLATAQAKIAATYEPGPCGTIPPPCTYTRQTGDTGTFTFGVAQGCPGDDNPCYAIMCNPGDARVSATGFCIGKCRRWTWGLRDPNGCFHYESANNKGAPHCEVTCQPPSCP
jgi:hypothetical protein